jgi:phage tail sheath protein FI
MGKRIQFASRRNNDQKLWTDVRRSLINLLQLEWRSGKLKGSKASQAFYVHCDRTTMTQNDLDQGRLIVVVGLAPVRPAEFQIIRLVQPTIPASNRIVRNRDHCSSTQDGA